MKQFRNVLSFVSLLLVLTLIVTLFPVSSHAMSSLTQSEHQTQVLFASNKKPGSFSSYASKATYSTNEDVVIQWNASSGATKYGLTVVNDSTNEIVFDNYITGSSITIGKLPAAKYRFQMAAYNSYGSSPITKMAYFLVEATSTQPPADNGGGPASDPIQSNTPNFQAKDKNGNLYYKDFLKMSSGGCVVYVLTRAREKLGYYIGCKMLTLNNNALSSGDGKDVVGNFARSDQAKKGVACANSQTDKNYTLVAHNYNGMSKDSILAAAQSDIQDNSVVSFNSAGSVDGKKGHVVFVEYVKREGSQVTVYFTEGGTSDKTDGQLKSLVLSDFVSRGGGMNGIATYIPMS